MISVIIPTLNEATLLPATLDPLRHSSVPHEIVVVDAGSEDQTAERAEALGCRVIPSTVRHRARQLNQGATQAHGTALLFLHADTLLHRQGLAAVQRALTTPGTAGGAFVRQFVPASTLLRLASLVGEYRSRWLGWHFGDQAQFASRAVFEKLGGFADWPVFEDLDLSRRLARAGRVVTLKPPILSSARRFARRGMLRTIVGDALLTTRYLMGQSPDRLAAR